jgi:hypothetical protein
LRSAAIIVRPDFRICRPSPRPLADLFRAGLGRRDRAGGVPQPIVEALNAAINRAIHAPAMNQFYGHRRRAQSGTPKEFAALIASDSKKWGEMIERAGVKLN